MKDKMVCFRADSLTLEEARKILAREGKTLSGVLSSYLSEIVRHGSSVLPPASSNPISAEDTYPSGYFSFLKGLEKGEFADIDLLAADEAPEDVDL